MDILPRNKKKKHQFIILLIGIFFTIFIIFSDYGVIKRISLEMQSSEQKDEIIFQKRVTDSMQIAIEKLKNDTFEIERIAREKYGMCKKNEDVYYIKPNDK
jgi:cell division protein FtsB